MIRFDYTFISLGVDQLWYTYTFFGQPVATYVLCQSKTKTAKNSRFPALGINSPALPASGNSTTYKNKSTCNEYQRVTPNTDAMQWPSLFVSLMQLNTQPNERPTKDRKVERTRSSSRRRRRRRRKAIPRHPEKGRYKQEAQQSYRSFSTTLMTEMLKVVSHATRLMNSTPPSAFCL